MQGGTHDNSYAQESKKASGTRNRRKGGFMNSVSSSRAGSRPSPTRATHGSDDAHAFATNALGWADSDYLSSLDRDTSSRAANP
ncbi:MAG: hypothetical protein SGPRY_010633 [Prymnesium sp.]